jgi:hypothetical protein
MGYGVVSAQPPGTANNRVAAKVMKIGLGWGEHVKPPSEILISLQNLKRFAKESDLSVEAEPQLSLSKPLTGYTVIFITSDQQFQLTDTEKRNLTGFVTGGGLLVVDNTTPSQMKGSTETSLLKMLEGVQGLGALEDIPNTSPIFHAPFDLGEAPVGAETREERIFYAPERSKTQRELDLERKRFLETITAEETSELAALAKARAPVERFASTFHDFQPIRGVPIGDRLAILFCNKGYLVRWSELSDNVPQLQFGVNLLAYALAYK